MVILKHNTRGRVVLQNNCALVAPNNLIAPDMFPSYRCAYQYRVIFDDNRNIYCPPCYICFTRLSVISIHQNQTLLVDNTV
jgi:uncharacterized Zn-finger protein